MNRERIADRLLSLAEVLVAAGTFKCPNCGTEVPEKTGYCLKCKKKVKKASGSLSKRLKQAVRMIEAGGRGVELGIREIDMLAREAAALHKEMRKLQWDISWKGEELQEALLNAIEDAG